MGRLVMVSVRSPASATVINAISTGKGSAFGIKLYITADVTVLAESTEKVIDCKCKSLDKPDMDTRLMELCVKQAYEKLIYHLLELKGLKRLKG